MTTSRAAAVNTTWPLTRRSLGRLSANVGVGLAAANVPRLRAEQIETGTAAALEASSAEAAATDPVMMPIRLEVNGKSYALTVDTRTSVLDALRENLVLKGTA